MAERPFCFDLDDLEVTGAVLPPEPAEVRDEFGFLIDAGSYKPGAGPMRAGERVPGVWVTHKPTGKQVISTQMPTRDENLAVALRRLDKMLRRGP